MHINSARTLTVTSAAISIFQGCPPWELVRRTSRDGMNGLFEDKLRLKTPDAPGAGR